MIGRHALWFETFGEDRLDIETDDERAADPRLARFGIEPGRDDLAKARCRFLAARGNPHAQQMLRELDEQPAPEPWEQDEEDEA